MTSPSTVPTRPRGTDGWQPFVLVALGWSLTLVAIALLDARQARLHMEELAASDARGRIVQDMVYRRWATLHGGVYVPVSEHARPNPYLEGRVEERDIDLGDGRVLTLVNPAYMTRQVHELSAGGGRELAHITSLDPLRAENGPDTWEREALRAFEAGDTLVRSVVVDGDERYMRVMVPMVTEEGCLKCHGDQGYRVGDVRGGLAVTVDLAPYLDSAGTHAGNTKAYLSGIWLLGLLGLGLSGSRTRSQIRELEEAEATLYERQERLEEAQAIGRVGHYTLNVDEARWTGSPMLADIFGVPRRDSYAVDEWVARLHPDDRDAIAGYLLDDVLQRPATGADAVADFDRDYRIVRADDGRVRWVRGLGRLRRDEDGRVVGMTGTIQDITERHRAREALRKDQERLRLLVEVLESADGGVAVVRQRLLRAAITVAESWTGALHLRDDASGALRLVESITLDAPADAPVFAWDACSALGERILPALERTGRPVHIAHAPGVPPEIDVVACPVLRRGQVVGAICVARSRSRLGEEPVEEQLSLLVGAGWQAVERARAEAERREGEERRAVLESELEQSRKLETVGRLAGGVAHDFNNMLSVIMGHAELALEEADGDAPELRAIFEAGQRSADLTRQLLTFARQETIEPRPLDLDETVGSMVSVLRRIVREEIELRWTPGAPGVAVMLDPVQVDQVLTNLVVNARDAISDEGHIALATRVVQLEPEACRRRPGLEPGTFVELTVRDSGPGIDDAARAHIFEPFFTTKPKGEGTGLGLATVHGIVRQNDGWIELAEASPGRTTFRLLVPVCERAHRETEDAGAAALTATRPATLLVVEDEAEILHLLDAVLSRAGYGVVSARCGDEALARVAERGQDLDLVLTDVVMPGRDGRAVAEEIQELLPDIPVIYMSGYAEAVLTHKGVLDHGVCLVKKPFTRHQILHAVAAALDGRRPHAPARLPGLPARLEPVLD